MINTVYKDYLFVLIFSPLKCIHCLYVPLDHPSSGMVPSKQTQRWGLLSYGLQRHNTLSSSQGKVFTLATITKQDR